MTESDDGARRTSLRLSLAPWVMFVRPRSTALGCAKGLDQLVTAASDVDRVALLDFEISFGRLDQSTKSWRIELSTLPWLEGTIRSIGGDAA